MAECPCAEGCPACIADSRCVEHNQAINKLGALILLQHLVDNFNSSDQDEDDAEAAAMDTDS